MGILAVFFLLIVLIIFIITRLKISKNAKIAWSVLVIIIVTGIIIYLFIQGFERGRDPKMPKDELQNALRIE